MKILKTSIFSMFLSLVLFPSCKLMMFAEIKKLEKVEIFSISENSDTIVLDGTINSTALEKFKVLVEKYPHIKQLEIINCDGSINDEVNLKLAKYIHQNNFNIHLAANGLVASGGTDLFLAGHKRTKGKNTRVGVHSWRGLFKTATDFPKGHEYHLPYIDYYKSVGLSQQKAEDFYYFTIYSAPAEGVHWMTEEEIKTFNITTNRETN